MTINNNNMKPFQIYNKLFENILKQIILKLAKPEVLHDFAITVKNSKEDFVNVIYFDYAKRSNSNYYIVIYQIIMQEDNL